MGKKIRACEERDGNEMGSVQQQRTRSKRMYDCTGGEELYVHEKEERHLGSVDDQQATIQKVPVLPKDRRRLSECCTRERGAAVHSTTTLAA